MPTADMPHGPSWSSLFSSEVKLHFVAPRIQDGKKSVLVSKSVLDKGASLWDDCLVGQFFGASPKLAFIRSIVDKLWGRSGRVEVIPLMGEGFMFKFSDPQTKIWVLEWGPWSIANRPILLRKWLPGLTLDKHSLQKFPLWIMLRRVPLELLTPEGLSCIASAVGTPLSLDKAIEQRRRVQFARVCVEVNCGDILPDQISVEVETLGHIMIHIEYAWNPVIFYMCKGFGHLTSTCRAVKEEWRPKAPGANVMPHVGVAAGNADGKTNLNYSSSVAEPSNSVQNDAPADGYTGNAFTKNVSSAPEPSTSKINNVADMNSFAAVHSESSLPSDPAAQQPAEYSSVLDGCQQA